MKINCLIVSMVIILLAGSLAACGPYQQRLQDGTLVASGLEPEGRLAGFGDRENEGGGVMADVAELVKTNLPAVEDAVIDTLPPTQTPAQNSPVPPTATATRPPAETIGGVDLTRTALSIDLTAITSWTPTATEVATETPTGTPVTPEPTEVPCLAFRLIADVTYPPNTSVPASTTFFKSWQVQNVGTCIWNKDFAIMFYDGFQLGGTTPKKFGSGTKVEPGQSVTITIQLWTPPQSGYFTSLWMMQDDVGVIFGGGATQNDPLQVRIFVPGLGQPEFTAPASTAPPFYTSTPGP